MNANHVLGIKAVLANGEVVNWGGASREQTGPDWCGLFTGNIGLFGIAYGITLQLLPLPEKFHTVLAGYRSLEAAGDAVSAIIASGMLPGTLEITDRLALAAAVHAEYPPDSDAALWKGRKSAFSAVGRLSPDFIVQDGAVGWARSAGAAGAAVPSRPAERRNWLRVATGGGGMGYERGWTVDAR